MQRASPSLAGHRAVWQKTLSAPALQKLNRWYVPEDVKQRYQQLQLGWQEMDTRIASGDTGWYQSHIEDFVGRIDAFVLALQHYTEHKIQLVIFMSLTGGLGILLLAVMTLRRIRRQVVLPLNNLVAASERIEQGQFDTPAPDIMLPNELGQLSRAFNHMSAELHTLYRSLEHSVAEKTRHLNEAHQQLEMLFKCSQALNTGQIDSHCFRHILQIVHDYTQMNYLQLRTSDDWQLYEGQESPGEKNAQFTGINAGHPVRRTALAKRDRGCSAAAHGKRGDDAGPGALFQSGAETLSAVAADGRARHHRARVA